MTCDSDGKIANFVSSRADTTTLPLHSLRDKEHYYLAVFLVGAYQEILGDMHNLFGDTNAVHVSVNSKGYTIDQLIDGETVAEVLGFDAPIKVEIPGIEKSINGDAPQYDVSAIPEDLLFAVADKLQTAEYKKQLAEKGVIDDGTNNKE
jgi:arginine decarboxylase-like protein